MNKDKYEEIINGTNTYKEIAKRLLNNESVLIGWTDEDSTHFDILFKLGTIKYGYIQRGIKSTDLFVGIIGYSFYGFNVDNMKYQGYICEKLNLCDNIASKKLTELINGIIKEINA